MSDKSIDEEIFQELAKLGKGALHAYEAWRRAHPNATTVPRKVWKQIDLLGRDERWNAKIAVRQQLRAQADLREQQREALFARLEQQVSGHRQARLNWRGGEAPTWKQHQHREWELARQRREIELSIASAGVLSKEERGRAVQALATADRAYRHSDKQMSVRGGVLSKLEALKARVSERFSRIRLGITERGRTGVRPRLDRPQPARSPIEQRNDLRHLIAERRDMQLTSRTLAARLRERGQKLGLFTADAQTMVQGHSRNLYALDREIHDRILGSGMSYDEWRGVQFELNERTPEYEATAKWLERKSTTDLEDRFRIASWPSHVDRVKGPDSLRRWEHDDPEREEAARREFLNPPADWRPTDLDAQDRFMFLVDSEHNPGPAHVQTFGYPQSGYDWAQRKMSWIAEPHENVNIIVWDRAIPLDANNRIRGFAIDSMHGLYAHLDGQLDRRYDYFRDASMRMARDRSIPDQLSVPGMEDLHQDRALPWTSVRAGNIGRGDRIHSVGESGRVWTTKEAEWFDKKLTLEQLQATFAHIERNIVDDFHHEYGMGWSEEIEQARFALDHADYLDPESRARAREILTVTETEAKLGQHPDRDLWNAVLYQGEFDRWSRLQGPDVPERSVPQAPGLSQEWPQEWPFDGAEENWRESLGPQNLDTPWKTPPEVPESAVPQTDPLAHVRKLQQELRQGAPRVARPDSPHTP
ncbi:hypothetical protein AB0L82_43235, partial [Nocardia sp. NPDC052001]